MNELEIKILNFIKNRGSFKQPIIASRRTRRGGYYLPRNDMERNVGLLPYKEQILTSQKTVTAITSVDLAEYWKGWQV